jgi:small subunit ribosomal protein S16
MKMMGRKHRPFYRICAVDGRNPRDGRVIEELGTYDPMIKDTDARVVLDGDRVSYWLGVGAQPTEKVAVLIKKYGAGGTHSAQQQAAREKMALPKVVPPAGEPKLRPKPAEAPAAEAEAPAETPAAETPAEGT